jgi:predicted outer membrane lipoprotein
LDKKKSAIICAFFLPALMVFILQYFESIPIWALVVGWACFFHLGGGITPTNAAKDLLSNSIIGSLIGWLSALAIFTNPLALLIPPALWGPFVIGLAIALITALDSFKPMSITPVVIYGFALNWGFLATPETLDLNVLTSVDLKNVAIAIPISLILGAAFGLINALAINLLATKNDHNHSAFDIR